MSTEGLPFALEADHPVAYAEQWAALNREADGSSDATPLAIKAAYVYGVIHDICESVQLLLKAPSVWLVTCWPTFGTCAADIGLLVRRMRGAQGGRNAAASLESGLWVAHRTTCQNADRPRCSRHEPWAARLTRPSDSCTRFACPRTGDRGREYDSRSQASSSATAEPPGWWKYAGCCGWVDVLAYLP